MILRSMREDEWGAVAELIHVSTNAYYTSHGMARIFQGSPEETTRLFCEVYESLDFGCCLVAENVDTGLLMGSCFFHPRESHFSLGIMNVHPSYTGMGVARSLLQNITNRADAEAKPTRLISSALNLDSFSLYSRAGFVPHATFQDMLIDVPATGLVSNTDDRVRDATLDDLDEIVSLEEAVSGIRRTKDWVYFIDNVSGFWHCSVSRDGDGSIDGVLASIAHPGSRIAGPGVMKTEKAAIRLAAAELDVHRGKTVLLIVPALQRNLLLAAYGWGGRNCEIHFSQCRGEFDVFSGVVIPTFMPETG